MLGFTFGVGDTTWAIYDQYWARQIEMLTLNKIASVAIRDLSNLVPNKCKLN